ncbi:MAG: hypothetical protein WC119_00365 [Synergistaceae bacterium]
MGYCVVKEKNLSGLIKKVNSLSCDGYRPVGGIAVIQESEVYQVYMYYQAMFKKDDVCAEEF